MHGVAEEAAGLCGSFADAMEQSANNARPAAIIRGVRVLGVIMISGSLN
jgi:hypothetical protein